MPPPSISAHFPVQPLSEKEKRTFAAALSLHFVLVATPYDNTDNIMWPKSSDIVFA